MLCAAVWLATAATWRGRCGSLTSSATRADATAWQAIRIAPSQDYVTDVEETSAALAEGDCVILLPGIASKAECRTLASAGGTMASLWHEQRSADGFDPQLMVRLPSAAAARRAALAGTAHATPIDAESDALCELILVRGLTLIDEHLHGLRLRLFGDASSSLGAHACTHRPSISSHMPGI